MSKDNQQKPSSKPVNVDSGSTLKGQIGSVKGGRITSEAPSKPVKPTKGNK